MIRAPPRRPSWRRRQRPRRSVSAEVASPERVPLERVLREGPLQERALPKLASREVAPRRPQLPPSRGTFLRPLSSRAPAPRLRSPWPRVSPSMDRHPAPVPARRGRTAPDGRCPVPKRLVRASVPAGAAGRSPAAAPAAGPFRRARGRCPRGRAVPRFGSRLGLRSATAGRRSRHPRLPASPGGRRSGRGSRSAQGALEP
jgi:hypothetical protein